MSSYSRRKKRHPRVEVLECRSLLSVAAGPVPYDGHWYYLLTPSTWTEAEAEAVTLGGHLATINSPDENSWVYGTFRTTSQHGLWIGLNDIAIEGRFEWVSGEPASYRFWRDDQPTDAGNEDYVEITATVDPQSGKWNDFSNRAFSIEGLAQQGVVEVDRLAPDLVATSLAWNASQAGVDFGYEVAGADLTQDTTAALYWASGTTFDTVLGGRAYDAQIEHPVGQYGPFYVPNSVLGTPPVGATHLLLAVDPPTTGNGIVGESDESNNILSLAIPPLDIRVGSATTADSRGVTFDYELIGFGVSSFRVGFYRSADRQLDPSDVPIGDLYTISVTGPASDTITIPDRLLTIDPAHPYVLVVADPLNQIAEQDNDPINDDNLSFFRKWTLGFVTHGYYPFGGLQSTAWVEQIARTLVSSSDYDFAYSFDWSSTSNDWAPGRAEAAGQRLATEVLNRTLLLPIDPNDVVDLHLIGHSRGAVVIDQALLDLERTGRPRLLEGGYVKMTMLDPHPASNSYGDRYSVNLASRVGQIAALTEFLFNAVAQDPAIQVPSFVHWSESFYQRTPWYRARGLADRLVINLWGTAPISGLSNQTDLTDIAPGVSHTTITDWYEYHLQGRRWP